MSKIKRLFYQDFQEHDHVDTESGDDLIGINVFKGFENGLCPNCNSAFEKYSNIKIDSLIINEKYYNSRNILFFCIHCGWWQCKQEFDWDNQKVNYAYQYHSILERIDISSNDVKISELKKHLSDHWNDRKLISASKAEELVKDILKEHLSCDVFYTTSNVNTPDGGIDLYVCHDNSTIQTAVQVKRRINREIESIQEVKNFVGAMVIEGFQQGIFVTTAERFTKPTYEIPEKLKKVQTKLHLDLIDGERLLEIMKSTIPTNPKLPLSINDTTIWEDEFKKSFNTSEIFQKIY